MSEPNVPKAFSEWLNSKRSYSSSQTETHNTGTDVQTELEDKTHTTTKIVAEPVKTHIAHTLTMESVRIDFPLKPYPAQLQMMSKIIHALNRSGNALLESPTGSGKSLALLCAALAWRKNESKKISEQKAKELMVIQEEIEKNIIDEEENANFLKRQREDESIDQVKRLKCEKKFIDDDFQPNPTIKGFTEECDDILLKKEKTKPQPPTPQRSKIPRIYVGSRTHKQLTQLISELKRNTQYRPKMTILGSRDQLCIHPKVSKSSNKNEDCVSLLDKKSCGYFHKTKKIMSHASLQTSDRIWDIEDMVNLGKRVKGCPYYASRNFFEDAEIIFCPYNYILDPVIRKVMDINLEDNIVILDEAHNMEDAARSAGSFELEDKVLSMLKIELTQIIKNGYEKNAHGILEHLFDVLWEWITSPNNIYDIKEYERHVCVWSGQKIVDKLKELNITAHIFQSQFVPAYEVAAAHSEAIRKESESNSAQDKNDKKDTDEELEVTVHKRKCLSNASLNAVQGIFMIFGYFFREDRDYTEDYRMALMKRIDKGGRVYTTKKGKGKSLHESIWQFKLGFWCLNPGIIFQDMCEKTRSVILTSGTLSPMESFATELDTKFPNGTYLRGIYSNIESLQYQDDVGEAICQISETVPFGVLCFLPSYNAMEKLIERWTLTGMKERIEVKKLFLSEPKGSDKRVFEKVINQYYDQINRSTNYLAEEKDGAIFFAVYRGKVSEGIDFTNEYCRAVIALGIPYPGIKDMEVQLKKEYNDTKRWRSKNNDVLSGRDWYSIQAYRAINQALGRCIRHKNDWGAIILLEDRFQTQETIKGLSKWIRGRVQVHHQFRDGISSLTQFIKHRLAIEQEQKIIVKPEKGPNGKLNIEQESNSIANLKPGHDTTATIQTEVCVSKETATVQTPINSTDVDLKETEPSLNLSTKTVIKSELVSYSEEKNTVHDTLIEDLDALMKDIDDDADCKEAEPIDFFTKPIKIQDESKMPVHCNYCDYSLMTGSLSFLKPIDNIHLNCVLYSNQNDTRMLEVQSPATWKTSLCLELSKFPTESQVYMNRNDKLCYQKINCICHRLIGIMMCGAISPEKKDYVGKVYLWENAVKYKKDRQKRWTQSEKKQETDDTWDMIASSQVTTMTDMFYNLP